MAPTITAPPRERLLEGLAEAITEKGYAATTIADVVRLARVSRRTFYEHFPDKETCFLALYEALSDRMLALIVEAGRGAGPWEERVEASARAYLAELASRPALTRTFLAEIQAAGPRAAALQRRTLQRFAAQLRALVRDAGLPPLAPALATAVVGGMNLLLLEAIDEGRTERLPELAGTAADLVRAVVDLPPR